MKICQLMVKCYGHHLAKQFNRKENQFRLAIKKYSFKFYGILLLYCTLVSTDSLGSRVVKKLLKKLAADVLNATLLLYFFFTRYNILVEVKRI